MTLKLALISNIFKFIIIGYNIYQLISKLIITRAHQYSLLNHLSKSVQLYLTSPTINEGLTPICK